jgi:hypothetical protein
VCCWGSSEPAKLLMSWLWSSNMFSLLWTTASQVSKEVRAELRARWLSQRHPYSGHITINDSPGGYKPASDTI